MTVSELGQRMSSAEFGEWMAFEALEPFGPLVEAQRTAQIVAMLVNVNSAKGSKLRTPADFCGALDAEIKRSAQRPCAAKKKAVVKPLTTAQRIAFLDAAFFGIAPKV